MNPLQYFEDNIIGHYNAPRRTHIVLSAEYNIYKFKLRKTRRIQMLNDYRYKPDSFFRSYVVSKDFPDCLVWWAIDLINKCFKSF